MWYVPYVMRLYCSNGGWNLLMTAAAMCTVLMCAVNGRGVT